MFYKCLPQHDEKDSFAKYERSKIFRFLNLLFITKRFGIKKYYVFHK